MSSTTNNFDRYDFKMYVGSSDILCFRAYVIDKKNYLILDVPDLGIDDGYKNLFIKIINGEIEERFYDKTQIEDNKLPIPTLVKIDNETAIENLQEFDNYASFFGVNVDCVPIQLHNTISFRYDGPALNLGYGLPYSEANHLETVTNSLIKILPAANNTDFGTILQMQPQASSTLIPYMSEKIDTGALETIKKVIDDINYGEVDTNFANNTNNKYANLYKKFILELKSLSKIKGLDKFEIKLASETDYIELINFDYLRQAARDIHNVQVTGTASISYYRPLKSKPNKMSLVVDYNGSELYLHLDKNSENFERLEKIAQNPAQTEIYFSGYKEAELVIAATELRLI